MLSDSELLKNLEIISFYLTLTLQKSQMLHTGPDQERGCSEDTWGVLHC